MKITGLALKEVGVTEFPRGSNNVKYNTWFYGKEVCDGDRVDKNGVKSFYPWCATFVSFIYDSAGVPLGNIGYKKGFAGCGTALAHFKKTKEIVQKPQEGDIVIFDWKKDGKPDHVGIFWKDNGDEKTFKCIEGNTAIGNDSNGGEVMIRDRKYSEVAAFVHPKVLDNLK